MKSQRDSFGTIVLSAFTGKNLLIMLVVGLVIGVLNSSSNNFELNIFNLLIHIAFTVSLWTGCGSITEYLGQRFSWIDEPVKLLIVHVLSITAYTVLVVYLIQLAINTLYLERSLAEFHAYYLKCFWAITLRTYFIVIVITMFMQGIGFWSAWKENFKRVELLKREKLRSKYESLKSQVNPHFLFNSLNALATLVHKDATQAEQFIHRLSDVYRYILETRDAELVDLDRELEMLNAYLFLHKIRFGKNLIVENALPEKSKLKVLPLALQMLVENAIKHNVISDSKPLTIELGFSSDQQFIFVRNNLQKKTLTRPSSGIGLPNIKMRYEYLSGNEVKVEERQTDFEVNLPVVHTDSLV